MNVDLVDYSVDCTLSPESASFTFAIDGISRACSHQLVEHGATTYLQQSQEYVNMDEFDYVVPESIKTSETIWGNQYLDEKISTVEWYKKLMSELREQYSLLVKIGIPEEDARYILPNACCTNIAIIMSARKLSHFFSLCCCERAQREIKQVAEIMLALVREVAPTLFEDVVPRCKQIGFCPKKHGCGKMPEMDRRS